MIVFVCVSVRETKVTTIIACSELESETDLARALIFLSSPYWNICPVNYYFNKLHLHFKDIFIIKNYVFLIFNTY